MKYLFLSLLLCWVVPVQAQIHNPSQRFLEAGGGLADGTRTGKRDNAGRWLKVGFGKYGKKEGVWQGALLLQEKFYQLEQGGLLSVRQYALDTSFTPKWIRSAGKQFYLSPAVGVLLGYEAAKDKLFFPAGDRGFSKWFVGFSGGLSGEWNFSNSLAGLGYARATLLPSSRVQPFHFHYGIALRFNFFGQ
jgi:hypothetical protein